MPIRYHQFAGGSLGRLAALSDGVFAVAMTLLVLDLKVPEGAGGSETLRHALLHDVAPRLIPYAMSFLTLGIFWVGQQAQLESFSGSTRALTWIHLSFLLAVTLMPFSTALLAGYVVPLAMAVYWVNLFALGAALYVSLRYADRAGLMRDETTPDMRTALRRRIVVYQACYALAALTCLIDTYLAMGLLVALQIQSVVVARIGVLEGA
jgi:TMEM175 potassium channel family protein